MLACIFLLSAVFSAFDTIHRNTVRFASRDGLILTADKYISSIENPYIVLIHEQESSRGEFLGIARRLCKMDYNCLAVDIRNGGNKNFVSNETVKRCREKHCQITPSSIEYDIEASIHYAFTLSGKPVILFGTGANGSLSLKEAAENDTVRAVVALSPGEYFLPQIRIQDTIASLQKPVFISSSEAEYPYVKELASEIDDRYLTLFEPELGEGARGSLALDDENETNSEYWLALLLFFKDLR